MDFNANRKCSDTQMTMKRTAPQFVVCVRNKDYPASLELRKLYRVVPHPEAAKHHQIRVVDESGEDYIYPEGYFVPVSLPRLRSVRCCGPPRTCVPL
jgi:hypothetical protein